MSGGRALTPSSVAERELLELFTGVQKGPRPERRVREFEVVETLDHHDTFTELLGKSTLCGAERVLRIHSTPPLFQPCLPEEAEDRLLSQRLLDQAGTLRFLATVKVNGSRIAARPIGMRLTDIEATGPEGLVFLSATTDVGVRGAASNDRVHTKKTILAALQDEEAATESRPGVELRFGEARATPAGRFVAGKRVQPRCAPETGGGLRVAQRRDVEGHQRSHLESSAAPSARTHSSTSESLNLQRRPIR